MVWSFLISRLFVTDIRNTVVNTQIKKRRKNMKKVLGRITSLLMAAILLTGFAPALNAEAALAKPENCRFVRWVEKDDFDDCVIQWNKVTGADGYQTLVCWTNGSHARYKNWGKTTTRATLRDLEDDHVAQVKVRAFKNTSKGKSYGPWSNIAFITPSPDDYSVKVVSSNANNLQMRITWDIIYGCNGYNVFLTTNPKGTWVWNQSTSTSATSRTAVVKKYRGANLKKYTNYYFRIVTRRRHNGVFCTVPVPSASYYTGTFRFK